MKKGIIFTTDAILALIVVMIFLAYMPVQASQGENRAFGNLGGQARDQAITSFYKGTASGNTSIEATSRIGKCAVYYGLDPNNPLGVQAIPQKNSFCEER